MFKFKKFSISIAVAAVLMTGAGAAFIFGGQAEAAKAPKSDVCHYQDVDEPIFDDLGNQIGVDPLGWRIINISGNALKAHLGDAQHPGHGQDNDGDGVADQMDFEIFDAAGVAACMALVPFIP